MDKQKYIVAKTWATDVKVFVLELLLTWKSGGDENCVGGWWSPRVSQCICPYYLNGIKWFHQLFANWIFSGLTRKKKYSIANISLAIFGEYIILYRCISQCIFIFTEYSDFSAIMRFASQYSVRECVCMYIVCIDHIISFSLMQTISVDWIGPIK